MAGPRSADTRRRILDATRRLLAESGTTGTGLKQIVAASGVAYGSIYHQFPTGKDELVAAAIEDAGDDLGALIAHVFDTNDSFVAAARAMFDLGGQLLVGTDFRQGCPIGTATADGHLVEPVRAAGEAAFASWIATIARNAERHGVPAAEAERLATAILALYEGGLLVARTAHSLDAMTAAAEAAEQLITAASGA
ncbi:MAG: TetR/AcrR family transcriptional regulator [Actinomycetota bacterium]